jgi:hypothetical protein
MAGGFSVTISAVDKASAKLDQINKRIAKITAPVKRLQASFKKFSEISGLAKLGNGFASIARASLSAFQAISRIVAPLSAITGAASVAGMYKLVSAWGEFGQRLGNSAIRTKMSADQLQALQGAAELSGASAEQLTNGMQKLGDNMVDAIGGRAPEVVVMMQTLGIAFRNADGSARKAADVLPELADKIASIKDPSLQARAATALMGGAAEELLPFLRKGSAGIAEYTEAARFYGVTNDKGAEAARNLKEQQTRLELSVRGLTNSIAEQLSPVLGPMLRHLADWIAMNREWISTEITDRVKEFATWVGNINWADVGQGIKEFIQGAKDCAAAVGGWTRVGEILFGLWVGAKFAGVLANVVRLGTAIAAVSGVGLGSVGVVAAAGAAGVAAAGIAGYEFEKRNANALHKADPGANVASVLAGGVEAPSSGGSPASGDWFKKIFGYGGRGSGYTDQTRNADIGTLMNLGWTRPQALGMVANIARESGGSAGITGDGGAAYGLAQWHPDRQAAFAKWAGHDIRDPKTTREEQLGFMDYELRQGGERGAGNALKNVSDAASAAAVVSKMYERPADKEGEASRRADLARSYDAMGAPVALPAAANAPQAVTGNATITIRNGTGNPVTAQASGPLFPTPPRVETSFGGPG